jgi:hypothetical protein
MARCSEFEYAACMTRAKSFEVEPQVKRTIERILRERLTASGLERTEVRAGLDEDDDPVLFVDAYYHARELPIDAKATFGLPAVLRRALAELGEARFPYVRHHFDEHQKIAS